MTLTPSATTALRPAAAIMRTRRHGSVAADSMSDLRDRGDRCERVHVAATVPRRLCMSRQPRNDASGSTALLDVHVSLCPPREDDLSAPALVAAVGELSWISVDDVVRTSLVDYVRFARHTVVDLSSLAVIDDRGAALLDDLARAVERVGGTIGLHDPGVLVEHVIRFCGVSDRVRICSPV